MTCPFLRETRVWSCQSASIRKLIPRMPAGTAEGRCRSAEFTQCPGYAPAPGGAAAGGPPCPLLRESLVQYCAASPVTRFVPYTEAMLSRCGNGSFRYCELYLDLLEASRMAGQDPETLAAPEGLLFTHNHMWIDLPEDGPWHIGIDAFLARLIGVPDRITYITPRGWACPAVAITVGDTDLQVIFPEPLEIQSCNLYLRSDPARLAAAPYTHGWLFEGTVQPGQREELIGRLLAPEQAGRHMEEDALRLRDWVEARAAAACDGGQFQTGLLRELGRPETLRVFHEFCSPLPGRGERQL